MVLILIQLWLLVAIVQASPYKGGTISWEVVNSSSTASIVEVIIYQKHTWVLSRLQCNQSVIASLGWYTDMGGPFNGQPFIQCLSAAASCTPSGFTTISQRTYCTDFSITAQISSGVLITRMNLTRTTNIVVGYTGSSWPIQILMNNGAPASLWNVVARIDLRQGYPINSSPITATVPIFRVREGQVAVLEIPFSDWDTTNVIRCRWASSTGAAGNECGDVCNNLPGANISSDFTITWLAVRRPADISANLTTSTYVAAIMIEDFANAYNMTPMSSVPLQVLISTYQPAGGACSILPAIIGDRPHKACVAAPLNVTLVERIVATVFCSGDYISEFITTSPLYMTQTTIANVSGATNQWYITLTWTPTNDQTGLEIFCAAPVDQRGLTGSQYCIYFVVGYSGPNLIRPTTVQGSASPLGTVFSNQSIFSIQALGAVNRPYNNGSYIQIFDAANSTLVWQIDCGYSPNCVYSGSTLLFYVQNPMWRYGAHYYILFGSGVVSGNIYCGPQSAPITDPSFWTFDIWDPGTSITTVTTTTTSSTTTTVTTPPVTLTTVTTLQTTTVLTMATASTVLTTSNTISGTATTVTDAMASTEPDNAWRQPMIIGIVVGSLIMLLITILLLYFCCTRQKKKSKTPIFSIITPQPEVINRPPPYYKVTN